MCMTGFNTGSEIQLPSIIVKLVIFHSWDTPAAARSGAQTQDRWRLQVGPHEDISHFLVSYSVLFYCYVVKFVTLFMINYVYCRLWFGTFDLVHILVHSGNNCTCNSQITVFPRNLAAAIFNFKSPLHPARAATSPLTHLVPVHSSISIVRIVRVYLYSATLNPTTLFHAERFRGQRLLEPTSL